MATCEQTLNTIDSNTADTRSIVSNNAGYLDDIKVILNENKSSLSSTSPLQVNIEDILGGISFLKSSLFTSPIHDPFPSLYNISKDIRSKIYLDIIPALDSFSTSNEPIDLTSIETNIAKNNTDIKAFKTLYEEHDIPKLIENVESILTQLTQKDADGNPFSLVGALNLVFNSQKAQETSFNTFSSNNATSLTNIFNNTEAIYTQNTSQNENIVTLTNKVNALRNTDLSTIETLISQIHNTDLTDVEASILKNNQDINAFKTLYEEHDRDKLYTDIANILKSVYNATPDTKTVLDYLNANDTLQAQHTLKLNELKEYEDANTSALTVVSQNTEASYNLIAELNTKINTMQTNIDTMQTSINALTNKVNALQNFNPTTIENKLDKILIFLGQEI